MSKILNLKSRGNYKRFQPERFETVQNQQEKQAEKKELQTFLNLPAGNGICLASDADRIRRFS